MSDEQNTEVNVPTPFGAFSFSGKKTAEFITILLAIGFGIMAYVVWQHAADAREGNKALAAELTKNRDRNSDSDQKIQEAIKEQAKATKLQTCILYLSLPEQQKQKIGFNERVDICR